MAFPTFANLIHLRRSQRWDARRAAESHVRLLRETIDHARRRVPLYRELYASIDPDSVQGIEDLARLPVVTKSLLKANFPDRTITEGIDPQALYPVATSGTRDRVMLFHDGVKRDWDRAADLLTALDGDGFRPGHRRMLIPPDACYERCGVDEHGASASVRTRVWELWRAGTGRRKRAARRVLTQAVQDYWWRLKVLKALGVEGTAVPDEALVTYLTAIGEWRPRVLHALPMYLFVLARRVGASMPCPSVQILRPAGGKATPAMIEAIESAFAGRFRENYGTAELGTISSDCKRSRCQHLLSELFCVEFVRDGRIVEPGELGELLITDLRNRVAPLIRYAVGDVGTYEAEPCPCGRPGRHFTVRSRLDETIVTPSGRAVPGDTVIDFFLRLPEVRFARVIQEDTDRFLVEIVPADGREGMPVAADLSEGFSEVLGYSVQVRPRRVRRIAPEPSGKFRLVISSTFGRFHDRFRQDETHVEDRTGQRPSLASS